MDLKAIDRYIEIPLKIGEFILDNSLFRIEELIQSKSLVQSNMDENKMRYEDIDIGVSGLILFLIELNKARPDVRLEMTLNKAGFELVEYCKANQRTHHGLYEGSAGLLLVLLHLYNISHKKWIIEKIRICLFKLIRNFLITDQGIVWNRLDNNIQPLNSFFYGSAGVAFVLQQMAKVSDDPELFSLAKAIFQNSDKDWSERISAWPDYRNDIKTADDFITHKTKFLKKEYEFFTKSCHSYDIAHGTAGICIARLPFFEMKSDTLFNSITEKGISKLSVCKINDLSVASGLSGIGSLYVEANRHFKNPVILESALKVADALNIENCTFDNLSLFYGTTGVGYFLLQLLNTNDSQSILYPVVQNRNRNRESGISKTDKNLLITDIFRSTFPYTFFVIKSFSLDNSLDLIEKYHFSMEDNPFESMQKFICTLESNFPSKNFQMITDVFSFEMESCSQ